MHSCSSCQTISLWQPNKIKWCFTVDNFAAVMAYVNIIAAVRRGSNDKQTEVSWLQQL